MGLESRGNYSVSIFVPVYNEEQLIEQSIDMIRYFMDKIPVTYDIFLVNDASEDKTKMIAVGIKQAIKNVILLNYEIGPTRRENLGQSFKQANGDIILFVDADLGVTLCSLQNLINQIISGYDIVIGSRYISGSKIKRRFIRFLISFVYNACIRFIFKTGIHDHTCGFKAFKRDVILKIIEEMGYDKTLTRGVFWDAELLLRACQHGYKVKEIPVLWEERNKSALSFKRDIKTLFYIVTFIRQWMVKNSRK